MNPKCYKSAILIAEAAIFPQSWSLAGYLRGENIPNVTEFEAAIGVSHTQEKQGVEAP